MSPKERAALLRAVSRARRFPANTDSCTRHVELIGRQLVLRQPFPMLAEEPEICGQSLLLTCVAVYKLRDALARLHDVCLRIDVDNNAQRPSQAEYVQAMRHAGKLVEHVGL